MSLQDEDSPFEAALKGDLPSGAEQARVRQRLLGAGISVGSGLAASSVAASTQVGWGASAVAKLGALSLAAKVGLIVAVAAPFVAVPVLRARSAARPRITGVAVATALAKPHGLPLSAHAAPELAPVPALGNVSANEVSPVTPRSTPQRPAAPPARADPSTAALPAVAAFDSLGSADAQAQSESQRATTLAAETQLLDRAFAEIAAGHRAAAAALIAEHQRRFPNGLLSQERERARARLEQNSQGE